MRHRFYEVAAYQVHKLFCKINPAIEMRRCYRKIFGKMPDIEHPSNLIEKIFWMTLHTDTSLWTKCADKYLAREYVAECGFASYLPKLYAKWDKADDINFDDLPNSFVLKANNGCGSVYIVKDKYKEDLQKIVSMANGWLSRPFGYSGGEIHYVSIPPCVIAEELLTNDFEDSFSPSSMVDFKVWCIDGKPESILLVYDRKDNNYMLDLYDLNWIKMASSLNLSGHFKTAETLFPKPVCLDGMLDIATSLSKPFAEVRVDFYIVNNHPVIGELTFSTGYGYFTMDYYDYLGSKIDLSKLKRIK